MAKTKTEPTEADFLRDVKNHAMTVTVDDGVLRHLTFRSTGDHAWLHWFEVVTWRGDLCIRGDCGTYVFSRLPDMFDFFRSSREGLDINADYWAEKLVASDCTGRRGDGVLQFDSDVFCKEVKRRFVEHCRQNLRGWPDARKDLRAALEDEVLSAADSGEHDAMRAASDFEHDGFRLDDFWEVDCRRYTYRFVWCLYAIVWAIRQYDAHKAAAQPATTEAA